MSDEAAKHFEAQAPLELAQEAQGRSINLTITLHPNRQIEFSLPTNKLLAHGLLGVAQEQLTMLAVIEKVQQMAQQSNGGGLQGLLKKMGRR